MPYCYVVTHVVGINMVPKARGKEAFHKFLINVFVKQLRSLSLIDAFIFSGLFFKTFLFLSLLFFHLVGQILCVCVCVCVCYFDICTHNSFCSYCPSILFANDFLEVKARVS